MSETTKLEAQLARALAVLRGQTRPVRFIVRSTKPRPRGTGPRCICSDCHDRAQPGAKLCRACHDAGCEAEPGYICQQRAWRRGGKARKNANAPRCPRCGVLMRRTSVGTGWFCTRKRCGEFKSDPSRGGKARSLTTGHDPICYCGHGIRDHHRGGHCLTCDGTCPRYRPAGGKPRRAKRRFPRRRIYLWRHVDVGNTFEFADAAMPAGPWVKDGLGHYFRESDPSDAHELPTDSDIGIHPVPAAPSPPWWQRGGKGRRPAPGFQVQIRVGQRKVAWVNAGAPYAALDDALVYAEHQIDLGHVTRVRRGKTTVWPTGGKARLKTGERGPRGGRTEVQSLLFPVKQWDLDGARYWAADHGYDADGFDITESYIRLRQRKPSRVAFQRYRTKTLGKHRGRVIKAVVGVR